MYFIAHNKVKDRFLREGFSDREALPYLIATTAIWSMAFVPMGTSANVWDYVNALIGLLFAIFGTYALYRANGGPKGSSFIQKYIILCWVLVIRALIVLIPLFFAIYGIGLWLGIVDLEASNSFDVGVTLGLEIVVWTYLYKHFLDLHRRESAEQGAAANP